MDCYLFLCYLSMCAFGTSHKPNDSHQKVYKLKRKAIHNIYNHDTNQVGCHNEIKNIDWDHVSYLKNGEKTIRQCLPVVSPWYGGLYKRMVGLVMNLLDECLVLLRYQKEKLQF